MFSIIEDYAALSLQAAERERRQEAEAATAPMPSDEYGAPASTTEQPDL